MADLSVLIPARNEVWLSRTVEDVCRNMRGDTDVIVVLDGAWADPGLVQHPNVHVVHLPHPIGQRAATNLAARVSTSRWIMKLDAHCSVAEGFDVALMNAAAELGRDVVQIPAQKHLHVFNQVCERCGGKFDQSPVLKACPSCKAETFGREIVWQPRVSPTSSAWRFDSELHFQYWSGARQAQRKNKYPEVMSCLGACWFLDRAWFMELDGLDEDHGSWGQMGTELACKAWLSGGRMVCTKATWFAHFFRVGGHGFPYQMRHEDQVYAQQYSRNLWRGNRWPKQVKPLRWLVEKFAPVPGWTQEQIDALPRTDLVAERRAAEHGRGLSEGVDGVERVSDGGAAAVHTARSRTPTKGVVYYTDNLCPEPIASVVREQLLRVTPGPVVAVSLQPLTASLGAPWPSWTPRLASCTQSCNITLPLERGYLTMFRQILAGLEALDTDIAFLCEHDVLYDASHFQFTPPRDDCYFYNVNVYKVDASNGRAVTYLTKQTSQLCANRELLVEHYRKRVAIVERDGFSRRIGFEPGSHRRPERIDDIPSDVWRSAVPNIDIRHGSNLTASRWSPEQFRDQRNCQGWQEVDVIPGWPAIKGRPFSEFLREVITCVLA